MKRLTRTLMVIVMGLVGSLAGAQSEFVPLPVTGFGSSVVASPDGDIAIAFTDRQAALVAQADLPNGLTVIRLADNSVIAELDGPVDIATSVAFTADGATLAVVHANGDVAVWNSADWSLRAVYSTLILDVQTLGFLPDGVTLTLLSSGVNPLVMLFDVQSGSITGVAGRRFGRGSELRALLNEPQGSMRAMVTAAALSPDGTHVATVNGFDEIFVRDIATLDWFIARPSDSEIPVLSVARLAFADSRTLVYMLRSGELHEYDIESRTDRLIAKIADRLFTMGVSRDGTLIAAVSREPDALNVVDRATGTILQQVPLPSPQLTLSPNFTIDGSAVLLGTVNLEGTGASAVVVPIAR